MKTVFFLLTTLFFTACQTQNSEKNWIDQLMSTTTKNELIDPDGTTIKTRIKLPEGFERTDEKTGTFGYYLKNLPLKPDQTPVYLHNETLKKRQDVHAAIIDISIGKRNLQQCADAVMRLRAEYLWEKKRYDEISFNFTNGFKANYKKWRNGYRIRVNGNHVFWAKVTSISNTHNDLMNYLTMVFSYAGTISLNQELEKTAIETIKIGDVFIKAGSPGHAMIVVDKAINSTTNEEIILLAQSYMPAQNIHIVKNLFDKKISPWYNLSTMDNRIITPEWKFTKQNLKKFNP